MDRRIEYTRKISFSRKVKQHINADSGAPSCVNGNLLLTSL